ncbi:MAG: NAD-dependent epimerase/dehydratase family protein [Methanospirillaceae archaeon]|nr:NAD-dependent epimerase/dehydratase family protein [Methanospirillaceae archaeon]
MRALVTGCAGFIGSHITDRLLAMDYEVIGIDCFRDNYPKKIKKENIREALQSDRIQLIERDLSELSEYPAVEYIFHSAAQAGVRASWGDSYATYTRDNIEVTQKLLEYYKENPIRRFIYASSSSVYGDAPLPMQEEERVQPVSPYGVTKLAAEHLCYLYWKNYNVPTVSLRYFTVFDPRQRPDMGICRFLNAVLAEEEITVYGDGTQTRNFTYVDDIVQANICAMKAPSQSVTGQVFNIGGGNRIPVNELIFLIGTITAKKPRVRYDNTQKGDVRDTCADVSKAGKFLG